VASEDDFRCNGAGFETCSGNAMMRSKLGLMVRMNVAAGLIAGLTSCSKRAAIDVAAAQDLQAAEEQGKAAGQKGSNRAKVDLPGGGFQFPEAPGGQLLAELLVPSEQWTEPVDGRGGPRPRQVSRFLDRPELPLPANEAGGIRVPHDAL